MNAADDERPPPEDGEEPLPTRAILAGLLGLFAAALAVGVADGVPLQGPARDAAPAAVSRLCFCGPGGEAVDFPAEGQRWVVRTAAP